MLFNSVQFSIFFFFVTSIYFLLGHKYRWAWLLGSSCYFYMAFVPVYILILGGTIVVDYFAGIWIEKSEGRRRFFLLVISLISNIGVLAFFKYFNFLNENLSFLLHGAGYNNPIPFLSIILPIGLSFHTFQAMSYTIEVYRGNQKPEKHFGIYALYVMFYPQLVAGPIERPQNMLHQFHEKHEFDYDRVKSGIWLMVWGLFKKIVIADRLAIIVNVVYGNVHQYKGIPLLIAIFFFAFQIYCDFSGYSDIALGAARVMGFRLMVNFDFPFGTKNISDFWRHWHISLSSWYNDYLYEPLVIAKRNWGKMGLFYAIFVTYFISGIWHGAGWTFIIFGVLHGLAVIYEILTRKIRKRIAKLFNREIYNAASAIITFCYLCFTWIFFRATTVNDAFYVLNHMFTGIGNQVRMMFQHPSYAGDFLFVGKGLGSFTLSIIGILFLEISESILRKRNIMLWVFDRPTPIRYAIYYSITISVIVFGVFSQTKFIYFQF